MALRLTTDDRAHELSLLEIKLSADHMSDVIRSQLRSNWNPEVRALEAKLGATEFERTVRDIANNLVQSLL